jgi:hypothetical protein
MKEAKIKTKFCSGKEWGIRGKNILLPFLRIFGFIHFNTKEITEL